MMFKGRGMKVKTSKPEQKFLELRYMYYAKELTGQTRENEHRESEL